MQGGAVGSRTETHQEISRRPPGVEQRPGVAPRAGVLPCTTVAAGCTVARAQVPGLLRASNAFAVRSSSMVAIRRRRERSEQQYAKDTEPCGPLLRRWMPDYGTQEPVSRCLVQESKCCQWRSRHSRCQKPLPFALPEISASPRLSPRNRIISEWLVCDAASGLRTLPHQ